MKILMVQKIVGIAGSENYLIQIINGLKSRRHEIEVLSLVPVSKKGDEVRFNEIISKSGVNVRTVYYNSFLISALTQIKKILKIGNYDIVHSNLIHADFFMALVKAFFYSKFKLVSAKHGYEESYTAKFGFNPSSKVKNLYWRLAKWSERQVEKSFAISEGLQKLYVGLDICKKERVDLIHYGFHFPDIERGNIYQYSENQLVIVGRLTRFKGHELAFKAIKKVKEIVPDVLLVVVGSGPLEEELKNKADDLSITENVKFLGYMPNGREVMADSDVILIPSLAEGFGVVVLEAFSVNKPIIAFDVPSLNEHISPGVSGLLIEPYDIDSYANAIIDLLNRPELRMQLAEKGEIKLNTEYTLNNMINRTEEFYNSVVNS